MRNLVLLMAVVIFIAGCDGGKKDSNLQPQTNISPLEAERQRNMAIVNAMPNEKQINQEVITDKESGIEGSFRCANKVMVDMNSGRETFMKGEEITTIQLNGTTGVVIHPTGKRDQLTFSKTSSGPVSTGHIYTFNNQELFESIQMNIDNDSSGQRKSALLTFLKPVANTKITVMGFCDY